MNFKNIPCILLAVFIVLGCSSDEAGLEAPVHGTITVDESIDNSGDYAGIGVTIIKKDSANVDADTLFNALTDEEGKFSGTAQFPEHRQYRMIVSRNNKNLGTTGIILADNDSVKISAQLPNLQNTLQISSREHDAYQTYQRVEKSFRRVGAFAQAGRLRGDSLRQELEKWPDIYWQVYQESPETIAGHLSAKKSIDLLSRWDKNAMMQKVRAVQHDDDLAYLGATFGKMYVAETAGLDAALGYMDTLKDNTQRPQERMRIAMERISLMYDSAQIAQTRTALTSFKEEYPQNSIAKDWSKSVSYDLEYLSPGDAIPEFSFKANDEEISREALKGQPYLLEITSFVSPIYQQQFDRTVVIHSIYKNYDFQIVTIPIDSSQGTVDAFFEQRMRPWPVASTQAFEDEEIIETFNIRNLPTRFLVDRNGKIHQRYIGQEYENIVQGIQQLMKNN